MTQASVENNTALKIILEAIDQVIESKSTCQELVNFECVPVGLIRKP